MKTYLLPPEGNFYKANLHCHTTVSDGKLSPEEVKDIYKANGYSIVAFTDHDIMIPHPELRDPDFLPLLGYEVEINAPAPSGTDFKFIKTCHICYVARYPETAKQVCWHRTGYLFGNAPNYRDQARFDESLPDYTRIYSGECVSDMMQKGREGDFFVTYNHPTWSQESYPEYSGYHGMHAMEVYNHSCAAVGYDEENARVYDDLLRQGKRIYCIAADDNHNYGNDSCGGFIMIKAPSLEYGPVMDALFAGNFYASNGPEIHEMYVEDGVLHIKCSGARHISCNTGVRWVYNRHGSEENPITEAAFKLHPDEVYYRVTVEDFDGKRAYTNAYFADEIFKD